MGWSYADEPTAMLIHRIEQALENDRPQALDEHHLRNNIMEHDEKMREILQGSPPVGEGLPNPPPHFNSLSHPPPPNNVSPVSSDGFDYSTLLQHTTAPSPGSLAMPDLSSLTSLFAPSTTTSVPSPYSPSVNPHQVPPPHIPPIATSQPLPDLPPQTPQSQSSLGPPPDLTTIISAYLNGTLVLPPDLDVTALTSSFLMGTLDINALWATHGAGVTIGGQPVSQMNTGTPGAQHHGNGETVDFDALLHDELYREQGRAM